MKLHLSKQDGLNQITGYDHNRVDINYQTYQTSLIVTPERIQADWPVQSMQDLQIEHLQHFLSFAPEIVLIGTGIQHRFISPKLSAPLTQAQIPVECMTTAAACRTYNILMAEGRKVLAALLL